MQFVRELMTKLPIIFRSMTGYYLTHIPKMRLFISSFKFLGA